MPRRLKHRDRWGRLHLPLAGWLFLGIAFFVGLAAGRSQAPMLFVLFGCMMGALHVSAAVAWRTVNAVQVRRDLPERAWQHQTVHLGYYLRNMRSRTASLAVYVEEAATEEVELAEGFCLELPPDGAFRAGARFAARRRGRVRLDAVRVHTTFPFGLVRAARTSPDPASLVIWPARGRLKRQLLYQGAVETSTAAPSGASGGQDEFFGLREYRPGDNPRWIHWRRSAAKRVPVVREMARPLPEVLWVVLDTQTGDHSEPADASFERLLRFAATLINHAMARGYRVGLAMPAAQGSLFLSPDEGRAHRAKMLDALADANRANEHMLRETLSAIPRSSLRAAQIIVAGLDDRSLARAPLQFLRARSRHLTVLGPRELPKVFEDIVPATIEGDDGI